MSAFLVDDNHLNVLVSYFVTPLKQNQLWYEINGKYGYMDNEAAKQVAWILYSQNVRSVNDRYTEINGDEDYEFTFLSSARTYSIGDIAGAIDCLEYQSCETEDYYQTDAYKILCSMRKKLLKNIAEREGSETWEITEKQKVAV